MNAFISRSGLLDELFRDAAPGIFVKPLRSDPSSAQIRVNVSETPSAYALEAEVPGVRKEMLWMPPCLRARKRDR
jgi:HSP20 family protein